MSLEAKQRKPQFNLRLDQDLLDWIKGQAEKNDRPMNYVIVHAIKQFKKSQEI
jgi:predicted transcriptional regulator